MNIPAELKLLNQFVGHRAKVPIDLKTGRAASSTNPATWCTFAFAIANYQKHGCDGIGFVFKPPYIGIDLDDSIVDGKPNEFAQTIIDKVNSYTEVSPSGTGLHIICKGNLPRSVKTETYEVYDTARYFTMTGNAIRNCPIRFITNELQELNLVSIKSETSNKQGWIKESLEKLKPGNIHNESIRIIGRLHEDGWEQEDIFTLLKPHIESIGGDTTALLTRCQSIARYPRAEQVIQTASTEQGETYSISSFLELDEKVTWIVPGIIAEKTLGFIAGLPETGKTWICMDLAIECAKGGGYWLGRFPVKDCKVLYIDQERWKGETKRRLSAIIQAKATKESLEGNLLIKSGTTIRLDLQHSFEAFRREIEKIKPTLVIWDSFATAHTKEENNRKDIQEVLERIKQIRNEFGCAFLFVDHEGKSVFSDEDKTPNMAKMVGSIGKPAAAEYVLTVRKEGDTSTVYHTKSTLGPAVEPFNVKVIDLDDAKTKISVRAY